MMAGVGKGAAVLYEESTVRQLKEKVDALARAMQGSKERQDSKKDRGLEMELLLDGYDARTQSYTEEPTLSKKQMLDHFEEARSKLEEVVRLIPHTNNSLSLSLARARARSLLLSVLFGSLARAFSLFLSLMFQAVVRPVFWSSRVCRTSLPRVFVR
jgi:hypothetical protein